MSVENKNVEIIGVYKVIPTIESIIQAVKYYNAEYLLDEEGNLTSEINWDNHENLCLVEMQIEGKFEPDHFFNSTSQEDQVPYMEFYLDKSGSKLLTESEAIDTLSRRVCFFLHFVEQTQPIKCMQMEITFPEITDLPIRLEPFAYYLPVD